VTSPAAGANQIDACALLTGGDVEAAVGRAVAEPKGEQVANLACCSYGDPEAPVFSLATLCVFVGSDAEYYAGAAAQARDAYELGKKNAASPQPVSGLGEDAYWDSAFETLHILQGIYEISLEVSPDGGEGDAALQVSKGLAAKALQGLP
jgi:hypothetical protein